MIFLNSKTKIVTFKIAMRLENKYIVFESKELQNQSLDFFKKKLNSSVCWQKNIMSFLNQWFNTSSYVFIKTSGSTGKPKEIKLEKNSMLESAKATCSFFNLNSNTKALLCLPTDKIGGIMMITRAMYSGMELIAIEPSSNPLNHISSKVDFAAMVALQVHESLLKNIKKLKHIKHLIIGGGSINETLEKTLIKSKINAYSTFGMTETISHIALRKIGIEKHYTTLPNINIDITNDQKLEIIAPKLLKEKLVTNDLIQKRSNYSFYWLGRSDNAIEIGGLKYLPELIEKKLKEKIFQRFVISYLPDKKNGNKIVLVIEGKQTNIKNTAFEHLDKYEKPKEIFHISQFPEKNYKIDRKKIAKVILNKLP